MTFSLISGGDDQQAYQSVLICFLYFKKLKPKQEMKALTDTSNKPSIQRKLEQWEKTNPTSEELYLKLQAASQRRDTVLANVIQKASQHSNEVKNVVLDVDTQKKAQVKALEAKLSERTLKVNENKENIVGSISNKVQIKMEKISNAKKSVQMAAAELGLKVEKKMNSVAERKEKLLAEQVVGKAAESNIKKLLKVKAVKENTQQRLNTLEACNQNKLSSAVKKKRESLLEVSAHAAQSTKKKLERAMLYQHAKEAELNLIQKKLEDKLLSACERKEEVIASKAAKAGQQFSATTERAKEVLKQRESMEMEIKCKSENKIESAMKRKKNLREEESHKIEQQNIRREKVLELSKDDTASMQKKLEDKLLSACERKEEVIASKAAKAGQQFSATTERAKEVLKQRESMEMEIKCKSENKIESAMKRKKNLREEESHKIEQQNIRREKALEAKELKERIEVPLAKAQLSLKLNKAAVRRESLLLEKVEHASGNGNRSRTNSDKSISPPASTPATPDKTTGGPQCSKNEKLDVFETKPVELLGNPPKPWHLAIIMLPLSLFSSLLGFVGNMCMKGD